MHRSWLFVSILLAVPAGLRAQSNAVEEALAMPVSPGALALLAEYPDDPRAAERIVDAMSDPRAEVRAAAARVAFVGGVATAPARAQAALEQEQDAAAAIELMRVALMAGPGATDPTLAAAKRLGAGGSAGIVLASMLGPRALGSFPQLREMSSSLDLSRFLTLASRGNLELLGAQIATALRDSDFELWEAYLETARDTESNVADGTLLFGVSTSNDAMRFETLWHLLVHATSGGSLSPSVRTALATRASQPPPELTLEEAFVLELIQRHLGENTSERAEWVSMLRQGEVERMSTTGLVADDVLRLLTRDEVRALSERWRDDPEALDDSWERARERGPAAAVPRGPTVSRPLLRTVGGYPPGFVDDLIRSTRCDLSNRAKSVTVADVQFATTGRPLAVSFRVAPDAPSELGPCDLLGRALVLTSVEVPNRDARRGVSARLLVLHSKPYFACFLERPEPAPAGRESRAVRAARYGDVKPPKRTKDKAPEYPESARQERVQGLVILEAIITPTGCVRRIRVVRSADERLDVAAIHAVMQWRYEPSFLDGTPVPIVMTVTVNFTLS